LWCEKCFAHFV